MNLDSLELNPNTPWEKALLSLCGGCAVVGVGVVWFLVENRSASAPLSSIFYSCMLLSLLFGVLRMLLRERYVLEFDKNRLLLRRDFAGRRAADTVVCQLDDIESVIIDGKMKRSRFGTRYVYGLSLSRRNGRTIEVLSPADDLYADRRMTGEIVAGRLGVDLRDCDAKLIPASDQGSGKSALESNSSSEDLRNLLPSIIAAVLISLTIAVCMFTVAEFI